MEKKWFYTHLAISPFYWVGFENGAVVLLFFFLFKKGKRRRKEIYAFSSINTREPFLFCMQLTGVAIGGETLARNVHSVMVQLIVMFDVIKTLKELSM